MAGGTRMAEMTDPAIPFTTTERSISNELSSIVRCRRRSVVTARTGALRTTAPRQVRRSATSPPARA
eukprot:10114704-Alexandrium_andersonii.AAC.1